MNRRAFVIMRAELAHLFGRPLSWIGLFVVSSISWGMSTGKVTISSGDSSVGGKVAWASSQFSVSYLLAVLLLVYLFFVAIAGGMAIVRDEEHGLGPLIHPTPMTAKDYVLGKAAAVFVGYSLVLVVNVLVMVVSNHVLHDASRDDWIGPLSVASYIVPAVVFALPAIAAFTGLSIWVGERTRRSMPVFVLPVMVALVSTFLLWLWDPSWLPPAVDQALMVLDPFAMRWLEGRYLDVDRGVDFYNHVAVSFDAIFAANRALLLFAAVGGLTASVRSRARSMRGLAVAGASVAKRRRAATPARSTPMEGLAGLAQRQSPPSVARTAWTVGRFELRALARQPGIYLFVPLIMIQVVQKVWGGEGPFGTELLGTAGTVAVGSLNWLSTMLCLLMLFYTVESLHRERQSGVGAIYYSTPAQTGAILAGKVLANVAMALAVLALLTLATIAALAFQGSVSLSPWPFLLVWGALLVPTFVVWTAFVALCYALTGHRYATYGLGLATLVGTGYIAIVGDATWLTNWPLWSTVRWSDISVFELDREALVLSRVAALAMALLFGVAAAALLPRRARDRARATSTWGTLGLDGLSRRRGRFALAALVALVPTIALGRAVAGGPGGDAAQDDGEDYRRAHRDTWYEAKVPGVAGADLELSFDPAQGRFEVEGELTVRNHHDEAIARFPVTVGRHFEGLQWTLEGEAHEPELRAGLAVIEPPAPLEPGETVTFGFTYSGRYPDGISKAGGGRKQFALPSSVVFTSFEPTLLPVVGYVDQIGVDEDNELEPRRHPSDFHHARLQPVLGSPTPFPTRIAIEGPADMTFNAVGVRTEDERRDGRRRVVWQSDEPVRFFNVVGGRWTEREGEGVRVFFHPGHGQNVDEMILALEGAREHFSRWFAPYPWEELKLSEFPALATYAQGFPTNITFSEGIGFLAKGDDNSAFSITAHEAAHQWWGNMVTPGDGPGSSVIGEGLAHFSTLLLLEEVKGDEARQRFAKIIEDRYLKERRKDGERPLTRVDGSRNGDTTLVYEKAGLVYWMLMRHMGREAMLAGLADFLQRYQHGPDFPAVADLLGVLAEHAPDRDAFTAYADQLFGQVVLPVYRLDGLRLERGDDGWRATATLENASDGSFPVQVACEGSAGATTVEVAAGERVDVELLCDAEPTALVVDPGFDVLMNERSAAKAAF